MSLKIGLKARARRLLGAAGLVSALLLTASVQPAAAFTATNQGCAGSVQVPKTNGMYSHTTGLTATFPTRFAWRSPCRPNATQTIYARYRVWRFDPQAGRWVVQLTEWQSASTAPGQGVTFKARNYTPGAGLLNVDVQVEWWTGSTFIGSVFVDYNATGDYTCAGCAIRTDPAIGAYIAIPWM